MGRGRIEKKKVRGGIFSARRKVCWNCIFILFAAVFTLAVLSRFVSVRNTLRLWHTVIWNTFPLAVFQHYWDLVINTSLRKSCLSLGWTQPGNGSAKLSVLKTNPCSQETGMCGGVGRSWRWWAGAHRDVIAPNAPM